jgi:hypothetical protein
MTDVAYSLTAAHVLADPAEAYRELRAKCPVHFEEAPDYSLFTVAALDDVMNVLLHPDRGPTPRVRA